MFMAAIWNRVSEWKKRGSFEGKFAAITQQSQLVVQIVLHMHSWNTASTYSNFKIASKLSNIRM